MADLAAPPLYVEGGTYHASDYRALVKGLMETSGVAEGPDCAVTANGTPNMSVNVAAGQVFVPCTQSGVSDFYLATNAGSVNLAIAAADPTNGRIDLIVARVYDAAFSGSLNKATVEVVTGTPSATPVAPAAPANSYVLAQIAVAHSVTSIVAGNITDLRVPATAVGGTIVCTSSARPANPRLGQTIFESDTLKRYVWNGSAWVNLTGDTAWTAISFATGYVDLANASYGACRYRKDGLGFVHFSGLAKCTNGTSTLITTLPAGYRPGTGEVMIGMDSTGAAHRVDIKNDGTVSVVGALATNAYISLGSIAPYLAEA